ncbi:MAG: iron-containing alcohol dehydrogenase [Desulfomicrobiaceae bacterium]|jgi:alcohol dehydrogenase class IV|nr:iron-containing alcohol dehydrogenase [Desulfomicrobiaceae bacterium]MBZ4648879.1 iron-containing alcohol dehydrogenase [Desulfomicrobiaceae bacterium]MBZ4684880.1 iron-containing alcohol dehydrogenase [Desulfomicrobiaceae bacterium]MDI3493401.1 hypothetical protein [Desulfomicrobiaceae bacterium]MDK2873415.1 hypothetical protein [Desulfomicrobiaceae bacterium]
MGFSFATAHVLFGPKVRTQIPEHAARLGRRCLLVTGGRHERSAWLLDGLRAVMEDVHTLPVRREPEAPAIAAQALRAREHGCDVVVAVGGGSVLDAGKALAALIANTGDVFDYLEVVGRAKPLTTPPLPMIAVPTTAGTGAEVTANAVLLCPEHEVKVSLRAPAMIPRLAVVDPELTLTLPPAQTAATGMDALTQLIEAFVSCAASPLTDPLCRDGIMRAARSLRQAVHHGTDLHARTDMALASLFSGMALANAKLGAVHGFAAPLGAMLGAAHGEICAALLPHVMEANITALRATHPSHPALDRYAEISALLGCGHDAMAGVETVRALCADIGVRNLGDLGLTAAQVPEAAAKAARASSMRGNPVSLDIPTLEAVLHQALGR